ncbi:MAG TPA: hypothetical protein VF506_06745 [Streptosporangiaceae bacterium]
MAEPLLSCPVCGHPTGNHNASGCTIGGRFDGCWCSEAPEDINAPEPVDEPVARELVGELRGPDFQAEITESRRTPGATCGCGLADVPANAGLHKPHCSRYIGLPATVHSVKRRGRPPRTGAAAYAALGEVLGSWRSYSCQTCGSRRYEAHECCGGPAEPVTLTMTRGHGDGR